MLASRLLESVAVLERRERGEEEMVKVSVTYIFAYREFQVAQVSVRFFLVVVVSLEVLDVGDGRVSRNSMTISENAEDS